LNIFKFLNNKGATFVNAYFPPTNWYKYETGELVNNLETPFLTLDAPLNEINVHIRAGYIVPYQIPSVTTKASRKNPFGLVVALNPTNVSSYGELFWDDGESADSISSGNYNYFNFTASFVK
jgi:alpha-glucosidase (family GH31 glycosyl hydrolase)